MQIIDVITLGYLSELIVLLCKLHFFVIYLRFNYHTFNFFTLNKSN
jgi:hypothetical protein